MTLSTSYLAAPLTNKNTKRDCKIIGKFIEIRGYRGSPSGPVWIIAGAVSTLFAALPTMDGNSEAKCPLSPMPNNITSKDEHYSTMGLEGTESNILNRNVSLPK